MGVRRAGAACDAQLVSVRPSAMTPCRARVPCNELSTPSPCASEAGQVFSFPAENRRARAAAVSYTHLRAHETSAHL
eukprot:11564647-Alexandrium_andersonii.AAC.1